MKIFWWQVHQILIRLLIKGSFLKREVSIYFCHVLRVRVWKCYVKWTFPIQLSLCQSYFPLMPKVWFVNSHILFITWCFLPVILPKFYFSFLCFIWWENSFVHCGDQFCTKYHKSWFLSSENLVLIKSSFMYCLDAPY